MKVSTTDGKSFTLTRETEADQQLLDALDMHRLARVSGSQRTRAPYQGGYENSGCVLTVDRSTADKPSPWAWLAAAHSSSGPNSTRTRLLRLEVQGLQIDVQCLKGRVVDVAIRAQQQKPAGIRGLLQGLANALTGRAARRDNSHGVLAARVTELLVTGEPLHDELPDGRHLHAVYRVPTSHANGEAHYKALVLHEGVEHRKELLAAIGIDDSRRVRAVDLHRIDLSSLPVEPVILAEGSRP